MNSGCNTSNKTSKNNTFLLRYIPAKRHGVGNCKAEEFTCHISVSGNIFTNRAEKNPAGFCGFDLENEDIRRFRWDRLEEVITFSK